METLKTFAKVVLIFIIINAFSDIKAQESLKIKKVDALINLTKFINLNSDFKKSGSKKNLFILSDKNSSINYELQSKNNFKYKNWQIICTDKYDKVANGSIVFITQINESKVSEVIKNTKLKNILTVADNIDGFCEEGGMINIKNEYGSYHFEINYQKIQDQNIEISSKLLALAKIL